jgi:hypothetical protein
MSCFVLSFPARNTPIWVPNAWRDEVPAKGLSPVLPGVHSHSPSVPSKFTPLGG